MSKKRGRELGTALVIFVGLIGPFLLYDWKRPLRNAVANADRVTVVHNWPTGPTFEIACGNEDISELIEIIDLDFKWGNTLCRGRNAQVVRFYEDDKHLVTLNICLGADLGWDNGAWFCDAEFTEESRINFAEWFSDHGYPYFESSLKAEITERKRREYETQAFIECFPEEVREIITGAVEKPEVYETYGQWVANEMADPKASVIAASVGLAILSESQYRTGNERLAQDVALTVDGEAFLAALIQMKADGQDLIGAARLFFLLEMGERIPVDQRSEWAAILAEEVLSRGFDKNKHRVLRNLREYDSECIRSTLHMVAAGDIGTEIVCEECACEECANEEPSLRTAALLCLAELGDNSILPKVQQLLSKPQSRQDQAALEVCMVLLGDPDYISIKHLQSESWRTIGLAAIEGIKRHKCNGSA